MSRRPGTTCRPPEQGDAHDITALVARAVTGSGLSSGLATTSVVGSTAGVTTIEFEPGRSPTSAGCSTGSRRATATTRTTRAGGTTTGSSHVGPPSWGPPSPCRRTRRADPGDLAADRAARMAIPARGGGPSSSSSWASSRPRRGRARAAGGLDARPSRRRRSAGRRRDAPAARRPHQTTTVMTLDWTRQTLDNGLDVIVHEDHRCPIAAVNLWYHVGSRNRVARPHRPRPPVRAPDVRGLAAPRPQLLHAPAAGRGRRQRVDELATARTTGRSSPPTPSTWHCGSSPTAWATCCRPSPRRSSRTSATWC